MKPKILITFIIIVLIALGIAGYSLYRSVKLENNLLYQLKISQQKFDSLGSQVIGLELREAGRSHESIYLDTSSKAFQMLDSTSGFFLVSVVDVTQYLNGYKLTLNIGNPTAATYQGFTLKIKWGRKWKEGEWDSYEDWKKSLKEKSEFHTTVLKPGYWNQVEFIVTPSSPEELGYLELSIVTHTISLY